jgi:hypothetical protein
MHTQNLPEHSLRIGTVFQYLGGHNALDCRLMQWNKEPIPREIRKNLVCLFASRQIERDIAGHI